MTPPQTLLQRNIIRFRLTIKSLTIKTLHTTSLKRFEYKNLYSIHLKTAVNDSGNPPLNRICAY